MRHTPTDYFSRSLNMAFLREVPRLANNLEISVRIHFSYLESKGRLMRRRTLYNSIAHSPDQQISGEAFSEQHYQSIAKKTHPREHPHQLRSSLRQQYESSFRFTLTQNPINFRNWEQSFVTERIRCVMPRLS